LVAVLDWQETEKLPGSDSREVEPGTMQLKVEPFRIVGNILMGPLVRAHLYIRADDIRDGPAAPRAVDWERLAGTGRRARSARPTSDNWRDAIN